ncbi:MAG TPA: tripartite tricarboxylate transporter substrate binding protein [Burkholderiales bacterium]|nr:tripartite tricarboxylate transporter substrate binding protein [Burkholderiales bacterium]
MRMLFVTAAAAWLWGPGVLFAQTASYPIKPVRYLIPFTAGDSPDIVGRLLGERLTRLWGQTVVVENRVGAGGTVGAAVAAKAPADGYSLFQCNIASNAIAASLYAALPYQALRDFAPISRIATTSSALIAHPSAPASSIAQLLAYAKANPGKLNYGSPGVGTSPHLSMELLKLLTKIDVVHVAYKGAAPMISDVLGGQIPLGIVNIPALVPLVQAGRVRALAITGGKRASPWPSVPTMAEAGVSGYNVTSWYGLCAPAGTPRAIIDKVNADLGTVLRAPDVLQRFSDLVIDSAPTSPEEFAEFIAAEIARWGQVVKAAGIPQQ